MSADNKNCLNFVKIIAGLPGTHCSHSIRLRLPIVSILQTENNLSTNACDDGAETKSYRRHFVGITCITHKTLCVTLKGEDLPCYSNEIESVDENVGVIFD